MLDKQRMLITGISGLLGNSFAVYFKNKYEIVGLYQSNRVEINGIFTERIDITDVDKLKRAVRKFNPDILIHCASLTNVEKCEQERQKTYDVNVIGTKNVVNTIKNKDVCLVYISSDSVYSGAKGDNVESDKVSPQNYYGETKYQGELEVLKHRNAIVLRTNIFGWNIQDKKSLGEWIIGELKAKRKINGFKDAFFSSIYTFELARIIDISIKKKLTGVYNCGSSDSCSKFEFAKRIADCFDFDKKLISPISIDEFNFKAKRGKNLALNTQKLQKALDYQLPTIGHSIEEFYRDYKCGLPEEIKNNMDISHDKSDLIPYGRQWIDENDVKSVINVLRSKKITQGPNVEEFENALAKYSGAKFAVAFNSGTSALHCACLSADIKKGDEVITSPNTFVASANCVAYCGGKPIFADIDEKTYNISPEQIDQNINNNTKSVIPVHFAGQSCDMEMISQVVKKAEKKYGQKIFIIEDACHALGSNFRDKKVGSCAYSDMAVMSFHPVKHITTGEGGAVLTNDASLFKKLKRFRSHGITNTSEEFVYKDQPYYAFTENNAPLVKPWYYEQIDLGYNYRITNIQCALGVSQLKKINRFRESRRKIVDKYNAAFKGINTIQIPFEDNKCDSNFHLYVVLFDFEEIGIERSNFMFELRKRGIQTQVHYIPVHTQPYYQINFNTKWGDCPNAELYYQKCLSIPLFPKMTEQDVEKVVIEITRLLSSD